MNPLQFYRILVIVNGFVPLLMLAWDAYHGRLGANSVNNALHVTGTLSLVFLMLSLCMTPLRWITRWSGWIAFRRPLGLYGFLYAILHVIIYVGLDRAMSVSSTLHEIWMRRFLQIGTSAVLLMVPLAVTSTNSMIRVVGAQRWKRLHRLAYVVAILGVIHYYLLVKSDVRQPLAFAGVLTVLLGARFGHHYFELRQAANKNSKGSSNPSRTSRVKVAPVPNRAVSIDSPKPRQQWKGELMVAAIFQETHDVKTFRLTSPDGGAFPFSYLPGQFLNLQLTIDGKRVNRSYTMASSPTRIDVCELSIKREPLGLASRFMHDQVQVGDTLKVSGPSGGFVFTGQEAPAVLLISGGVGITPVMSILRYLTDRAWSGEIYFLIVAKSENDLVFHDEIQWLKARFPQLHVCETLTQTNANSMWRGERGRANAELLKRFVPKLPHLPVYLCGPNEMMDATRELLTEIGVPELQIKTEAFGSRKAKSPLAEDAATPIDDDAGTEDQPGTPFIANVGLSASGRSVTTSVSFARSMIHAEIDSETTILEAAEASSIELPYECRAGICGQCKTRLVEGTVVMECEDALAGSEKANGWILACQARPSSNVTVEA